MKAVILAGLIFSLGCATAPTQKVTEGAGLDDRLKQKAKTMNVTVHGVLENQVKGAQCSTAISKVNGHWKWADAVVAANMCLRNHDFHSVEKLANQLAVRNTSTPWGPYFFAQVAFINHDLDRALWMVELSLKRAPEFGIIHYLKGQVLWARDDFKMATTEFETAVSLDEGIGPAHLLLGQVYLRDQDYSNATGQFSAALKTLPDNVYALNGKAECELHLNNPDQALEAYVRLTDLDESDGRYLTQIGALYEGPLNNPERAMHAYQKLHDMIKAGKITKNIDLDNDSKIKELQAMLERSRALASTQDKKKQNQAGDK